MVPILLSFLILLALPVRAQVRISEFMAANNTVLNDEDGENADWIELHNAGTTNVNLAGWFLTDATNNLGKWQFPATNLPPNRYLVVFASEKNRRVPGAPLHTNFRLAAGGEFLALVQPDGANIASQFAPVFPPQIADVSYGVVANQASFSVLTSGVPARALVPSSDALGLSWAAPEFDDAAWLSGATGVGYDRQTLGVNFLPLLGLNVESAMYNLNQSVYVRVPFVVDDPSAAEGLALRMRFEDGFVAYLNGIEVARSNAPAAVTWNSGALGPRTDTAATNDVEFDLTGERDLLFAGTNVLALHGLNNPVGSPDLLLLPQLVGIRTAGAEVTRYFPIPTPGAANNAGVAVLGPIIADPRHTPAVPADGQDILVTARLRPAFGPVASVALRYRVMFSNEVTVPFLDDGLHGDGAMGDGVYGGVLPASASSPGQMVRWYVTAADSAGHSSRLPSYQNTNSSPAYFGTVVINPALTNDLPVFHWFVQNTAAADSGATVRASVFYHGEFYDNVLNRVRGASAPSFPKKPYKFDFNPGEHFRYATGLPRVDEINLNTTYQDKALVRTPFAFATYREAGVPASDAFNVRVERNGVFFNISVMTEQVDDTFLERRGLDPEGALYKLFNGINSASSGVEKKTRRHENNSDLQQLVDALALNNPARGTNLFDFLDLPEVLNYLAAGVIAQDWDRVIKNIYVYRDSRGTRLWQLLPWDKDLSFGKTGLVNDSVTAIKDGTSGASGEPYVSHPFYGMTGRNCCGVNNLFDAVYNTPATREMFLRRLRTLMEELLQPPGTPADQLLYEAALDELYPALRADAALDLARWGAGYGVAQDLATAMAALRTSYFAARRPHLFDFHSLASAATNPAAVGIPPAQSAAIALEFGAIEFNPGSGQQAQEFVELINANPIAVDISGWELVGGVRYTFMPGTVIPAGRSAYVSPDVAAFKQRATGPRGGQGLLVLGNYEGRLSARGETLRLLNATGREVRTNSYPGQPSAAQRFLRVTEIMFHPPPAPPGGTNSPDDFEFIELRNTGISPLDLRGVRFTEGILFSFTGGAVTNLAPGQALVVVKQLAAFAARYGGGFLVAGEYTGALDNNGERVQLLDAGNEEILDFEFDDDWYPATDGLGFSLVITDDGAEPDAWSQQAQWRPSSTLHGSPAAGDPAPPGIAPVVINEVLSNTDAPTVDALELHNPTATAANVGGWFLTDDPATPRKFRLPENTMIPAGGFAVFTETNFNTVPGAPGGFALSSDGDEAWLFSANAAGDLTGYAHGYRFGAAATGVSFGRHLNSVGEEHFTARADVTLSAANSGPLVGPVIVSEIMYHPDGRTPKSLLPEAALRLGAAGSEPLEFIELRNLSASPVALFDPLRPTNTWRFRDAVDFEFPPGLELAPGAHVLVVSFDPAADAIALDAFRGHYSLDSGALILGPYRGQLGNDGERIELERPDAPALARTIPFILVEAVRYRDAAPWPREADGGGSALQRWPLTAYANDPASWIAAGRTPGASNVFNAAPNVHLTSPAGGTQFSQPAHIVISATADDPDGAVARVEFLANGQTLGSALAPPYSFTWSNAPSGAHALTAKAFDALGASRESLPVNVSVMALPPTVTLTAPPDGAVRVAGLPITLLAAASDSDGIVARVEFFDSTTRIGEVTGFPFSVAWTTATVGVHSLWAKATDNAGLIATSQVARLIVAGGSVNSVTLVATGAVWKYFDRGQDLGAAWREPGFNDGSWTNGPAELGYGDASEGRPEATVIGFGPDPQNKFVTTYFRGAFTVANAAAFTELSLRVLRDDGAVIYVNGTEIFRTGMPEGPVSANTLANVVVAGAEESQFFAATANPAALVEGANVLAVEVHQRSGDSSDLSFDLELNGTQTFIAPFIVTPPAGDTVAQGADVTLNVAAIGTSPMSYQWRLGGTNLPGANGPALALANIQSSQAGDYSVVIANSVGSVTSATATVTIFVPGDYAMTVLADQPIHYYRLNEISGATAADSGMPGSNHGALAGGVTLNQPSVSGLLGAAARFNGNGGTFVNLGLFHPGNAITVESWVLLDPDARSSSYHAIVARWDGSYELDFAPGDFANFVVRNQAGAFGLVASATPLARGQWHHLAGVYTAGALKIYVNGALSGTATLAGALRNGGPAPDRVLIGATRDGSASSFNWKGLIDEVAVYNFALNPARMQAHYRVALPPPPALTFASPNVLAWPDYHPDFRLQFTPALTPPGQWLPDPSPRLQQNGFFQVIVPFNETNRFYRLMKP